MVFVGRVITLPTVLPSGPLVRGGARRGDDQERRQYAFFELEQPMEITMLIGNISLEDGKPMVHAPVTLTDATGTARGGHLASGSVVFACKHIIQAFDEPVLERDLDDATGLPLWMMGN